MKHAWIAIDGEIMPAAEAQVPVLDRGFLFGDAVYEVFATRRGRPLFWSEHVGRLRRSAAQAGLPIPLSDEVLLADVHAATAKVPGDAAYVRLMITGGPATSLRWEPPAERSLRRIVLARPLPTVDPALKADGCALHIVRVRRRDGDGPVAKRTARPDAILERTAAQAAGAYEALRVDELGRVLEGATSTFFGVCDGHLYTAPLAVGVLDGITRRHVLAAADAAGIPVREQAPLLANLHNMHEAFITSSTRGVVPVCAIDARRYPVPGPLTARLAAAYEAEVEAHLG